MNNSQKSCFIALVQNKPLKCGANTKVLHSSSTTSLLANNGCLYIFIITY